MELLENNECILIVNCLLYEDKRKKKLENLPKGVHIRRIFLVREPVSMFVQRVVCICPLFSKQLFPDLISRACFLRTCRSDYRWSKNLYLQPTIGPSGVRALPWLLAQTKVATILGIFPLLLFFFLRPLFKTTEGVVVLFQIFAWAPKKNNKNLGKKKI